MPPWPYRCSEHLIDVTYAEEPGVQPIRVIGLLVVVAILAPTAINYPVFGILFFGPLLAIAAYVAYRHATGERPVRIVLTPAGCRVTLERGLVRRSRRDRAFRWGEVSATRFDVFRPGPYGDGGTTSARLVVVVGGVVVQGNLVAGGETALDVDTRMVGHDTLLTIVNAMTPHLPYRWERAAYDRNGAGTHYERVARTGTLAPS